MAPERDLFANFERMRREMDELFGDVFERTGLARRRTGFSPPIDVYQGRELTISGHRRPKQAQGRVYQQLEIEHGPFRRVIALGADVRGEASKAVYEDGFLQVELPLRPPQESARSVPIEVPKAPEER